jgi:hypothetical protein
MKIMMVRVVGLFSLILMLFAIAVQAQQDVWYGQVPSTTTSVGFSPYGVAFEPDGRLFSTAANSTIQVLSNGVWSIFISNSFGPGLTFSQPLGMVTDANSNLYVADGGNNCVFEFSGNGAFIQQFGPAAGAAGTLNGVRDVAIGTNGLIYIVEYINSRISVYNSNGTFNSLFVTNGALTSQVNSPVSIAASDNGKIFVTQNYTSYHQEQNLGGDSFRMLKAFDLSANPLFQVSLNDQRGFQDECNNGHDYLGPCSVRVDHGGLVHVISSACGTYYQCINNGTPSYEMYWRIFTTEGTQLQLNQFSFGPEWNTGELFWPCQAIGNDGTVVIADADTGSIQTYLYAKRELQPQPRNAPSLPEVCQVLQRSGTSIFDIYAKATDVDDALTRGGLLVFTNGVQSLSDCIVPISFTEGTGTNINTPISANQTVHFVWNAGSDWTVTNVTQFKVAFMAKDDRQGLLEYHSLILPQFNGMGPLQISASPLIQSDFQQMWYWQLATNDPGIALSNGVIYGVGGSYSGQVLCNGDNNTTANGRAYLFAKMNVRQATSAEVSWASQGPNIGITNQFAPTVSVDGRPMAVNEYGFDTGPWGTNAWWIVPLP